MELLTYSNFMMPAAGPDLLARVVRGPDRAIRHRPPEHPSGRELPPQVRQLRSHLEAAPPQLQAARCSATTGQQRLRYSQVQQPEIQQRQTDGWSAGASSCTNRTGQLQAGQSSHAPRRPGRRAHPEERRLHLRRGAPGAGERPVEPGRFHNRGAAAGAKDKLSGAPRFCSRLHDQVQE